MKLPFENDTSAMIKKLATKNFAANKMRNIMAIIAIALTAILFTSLFTLGTGIKESTQQANMILSGGDGHIRIIEMSESEYETISSHPLIQEIAASRKLADSVDNASLAKRNTSFEYHDDIGLQYLNMQPTSGHRPLAEDEIIADTTTLDLLGVPKEIGAKIILELTVNQQKVTRAFTLAGWWRSYPGITHGTIVASKAYVQSHQTELSEAYEERSTDTGAMTARIKFKNDKNIVSDLETVLKDTGFSSDDASMNYINAGINPLYLSSERSNSIGTVMALVCALLVFIFSGYLIIYNIFQISILNDLHFYGMLKTIGATERQISTILSQQAWWLSLMGIPTGLLIGFFVGKLLLPLLVANAVFSVNIAVVSPHPLIFIAAAIFAWLTVQISMQKPKRLAAKVTPIEAIRYIDSSEISAKRPMKRSYSGNPALRMAWANLGRNKKRTILVIMSLSLSLILTSIVFTFSHSVNPTKAMQNMMDTDFSIGQSRLFNQYKVDEESALSESYLLAVQQQEGFEIGGAEYGSKALYKSETSKQMVNQQDDSSYATHIYGLENFPLSLLKVFDGEMDREKLMTGNYILEGAYVSSRGVLDEDSLNHAVGDKIELAYNGKVKEFTVLGHVIANEANTYDWVGSCFFLPSDIYMQFTGNDKPMSYKFNVAEGKETIFDTFLKTYTTENEPEMTYLSRATIMAGVKDIQNTVVTIGGTLAFIMGVIGLLNFANAILTSIFTRRQELAILKSIGMTNKQMEIMLCVEGGCYIGISTVISLPWYLFIAWWFIRPISQKIWFLDFKMNLWPLLVMTILLLLIGVLLPYLTCQMINKKSVVERLMFTE